MPSKKKPAASALITSYQIDKSLFLVSQVVPQATAKPTPAPTNHIAVIDVSGSMSGDLPQMREQLKKKLTKLLRDGDSLSMIWFSGRGQTGVLFEAEPVVNLSDLKDIHTAIDRWLRPVGMTGFKEPLQEVEALIGRVGKKNKNPFSLFFMSDGCDNQWTRPEILGVVERAAKGLASATFVEYGYYADRPLLAAMAEKCGGTLIFADAFDKYEAQFESSLAKQALGGPRVELPITGDPIGGFAFALFAGPRDRDAGEIVTYEAGAGKIVLSEDTREIFYLSPRAIGTVGPTLEGQARSMAAVQPRSMAGTLFVSPPVEPGIAAAYAALSLFAVRMKPELVWPILKALGDVSFIEMFGKCFGKQKYTDFMNFTKAAAFTPAHRWMKGFDPNKVPDDNAFTVLDLLRVLTEDGKTQLLLDDPAFKYSRISRKRDDVDDLLDDTETEKIAALQAKMAAEKSATKLRELRDELSKLLAMKREPLKFVADPAPDGYEINGLVYNESRPNVSMRVLKAGMVDLSTRISDVRAAREVPPKFKSQIWRNYTLIKDGLVNIETVPALITDKTLAALKSYQVPHRHVVGRQIRPQGGTMHHVQIEVGPLPIINRKMVKAVSAVELAKLEFAMVKAKAEQKVFNHYVEEKYGDAVRLKSFVELYGEDGAAWLKEQGLTPNGYAPPHTKQAEATDVYIARELDVKLAGYGDLPSVANIVKRVSNPKSKPLAGAAWLVGNVMHEVEEFLKNNPTNVHQKWLVGRRDTAVAMARGLMHQAAAIKYAILVGNVWFTEFASIDQCELTVILDGNNVKATFVAREIEVEI